MANCRTRVAVNTYLRLCVGHNYLISSKIKLVRNSHPQDYPAQPFKQGAQPSSELLWSYSSALHGREEVGLRGIPASCPVLALTRQAQKEKECPGWPTGPLCHSGMNLVLMVCSRRSWRFHWFSVFYMVSSSGNRVLYPKHHKERLPKVDSRETRDRIIKRNGTVLLDEAIPSFCITHGVK